MSEAKPETSESVVEPKGPPSEKLEYQVDKLNSTNYVVWKWQILNIFRAKRLDKALDLDAVVTRYVEQQAMALLGSSLDEENKMYVVGCEKVAVAWSRLEAIYENRTTFEKQDLLGKLHSFKIANAEQATKALAEIQTLASRLNMLGETITDDALMSIVMRALPSGFSSFITAFKLLAPETRTLQHLISNVIVHAREMQEIEGANQALIVKPTRNFGQRRNNWYRSNEGGQDKREKPEGGNSRTCYHCGGVGHIKRFCWKLKGRRPPPRPKSPQQHAVTGPKPVSFMANNKGPNSFDEALNFWIADSGCSMHMTPRFDWLIDYQKLERTFKIWVGNGEHVVALGKGKVLTNRGEMQDVYYAPNLKANLFSIRAVAKKGLSTLYVGDMVEIFTKDGEIVLWGYAHAGIYLLDMVVRSASKGFVATTMDMWHRILGHVSKNTLERMVKDDVVKGLKIAEEPKQPCGDCVLGKCTRASHPTRSSPKSTKPGEVLHMDTVDVKTLSLGSARYFILCRDEASSYRQVEFSISKTATEIGKCVKRILTNSELETGDRTLKLFTDNGTEYVNDYLQSYLDHMGIVHDTSEPYTPQQNGFIERDVRTIVESAKTMLLASGLPKSLWAEAVNTAVYCLNRCVNSRTDKKTPFEIWFGRKPDLSNMRVFGTRVIKYNTNEYMAKFDARGREMYFVGYTKLSNTYRVYDSQKNHVVISCNVTFVGGKSRFGSELRWIRKPQQITVHDKVGIVDFEQPVVTEVTQLDDNDVLTTDQGGSTVKEVRESSSESPEASASAKSPQPSTSTTGGAGEITVKEVDPEQLREILKGNARNQLLAIFGPNAPLGGKSYSFDKSANVAFDPHSLCLMATIDNEADPPTYHAAMKRNDADKWVEAMEEEIESIRKNGVFEVVDRPSDKNIVSSKWVLRIKRKPTGEIARYKARLVARGFTQQHGVDYYETFSPVANATSIRLLLANAAANGLRLACFDVKCAFLNGDLHEEVFMQVPEGVNVGEKKVWRLKKSLYGLKQSPRQWNQKFLQFLASTNLSVSETDSCIFYNSERTLIVALYVDDGLITAANQELIDEFMLSLKKVFDIHIEDTTSYLGFQIERGSDGSIFIHQTNYVDKVLKKFKMENCKPRGSPASDEKDDEEDNSPLSDNYPYREAVGSLIYASVTTRPDIAYAVNQVSKAVASPTTSDWLRVKKIFRYLQGQRSLGIRYGSSATNFEVYCDADFAGEKRTARSTTGLIVLYATGAIHWKSQRQKIVTLSSTEAELVAVCTATKEVTWIDKLAKELMINDGSPMVLKCDNTSALKLVENEGASQRTRHISVRPAFVREKVNEGILRMEHVKGTENIADTFTKTTTIKSFVANRSKFMSTGLLMLMLLCLQMVNAEMIFENSSPVIIRRSHEKVLLGTTKIVKINNLLVAEPCNFFLDANVTLANANAHDYFLNGHVRIQDKCHQVFGNEVIDKLHDLHVAVNSNDVHSRRQKRFLQFGVSEILEFSVVTNLLASAWHWFRRDADIEKMKTEFTAANDAGKLALKKTVDALDLVNGEVAKIKDEYQHSYFHLGDMSWSVATTINEIYRSGTLVDKIISSVNDNELDTMALAKLLHDNDTLLTTASRKHSSFEQMTIIDELTYGMRLRLVYPAERAYVGEVIPFEIWTDLSSERPKLMKYIGRRFVVHNMTNNCMVGVIDELASLVTQGCTKQNYRDEKKLDAWEEQTRKFEQNTQFVSMDDYVHVYCYPGNISVEGVEAACPPSVFRIPNYKSFVTSDASYSVSEIAINNATVRHNVEAMYFSTLLMNDSQVVLAATIRSLKEELALKGATAFAVGANYNTLIILLPIVLIELLVIVYLVWLICKRYKAFVTNVEEVEMTARPASREDVRRCTHAHGATLETAAKSLSG